MLLLLLVTRGEEAAAAWVVVGEEAVAAWVAAAGDGEEAKDSQCLETMRPVNENGGDFIPIVCETWRLVSIRPPYKFFNC